MATRHSSGESGARLVQAADYQDPWASRHGQRRSWKMLKNAKVCLDWLKVWVKKMGTISNLSGVVAIEHQMFNGMVLKGMWCSKQTGFCVPIVLERPCQTCLWILWLCTLPSSCLNCFPFGQERFGSRGTVGYSQIPSSEPTECCPDDFKGSTTLRKWQSLKDPNVKILKSRCKKSQLHNLETKGGEYHSDAGESCRQTCESLRVIMSSVTYPQLKLTTAVYASVDSQQNP